VHVEKSLERVVAAACVGAETGIANALWYAVGVNGKRLRPQLVIATAESLGFKGEDVIDAACALELVHCASLVLDDLPAMDDASIRRGRTAVHLEFGEATAILVTHALLAEAFRLVACNCSETGLSASKTAMTVALLAKQIGLTGMIGGQAMDLSLATVDAPETVLEMVCRCKTASLFCACVLAAGHLCRASDDVLEGLELFAERLGMAFQIRDDILDISASQETAGKNVDQDRRGTTLARRLGVDEALLRARAFEKEALTVLGDLDIDPVPLEALMSRIAGEY